MVKIYIDVNPETNRIEGWGSSPLSENSVKIEVDEGHDIFRFHSNFLYVNGEIVEDENYQEPRLISLESLQKENEMLAMAVIELSTIILNGGK